MCVCQVQKYIQRSFVEGAPYGRSLLRQSIESENFTTLAVIDPKMHSSEELYATLGLFEGEINVHEKETEKGSVKFLKIKKMSNQEYVEDELPLKKEQLARARHTTGLLGLHPSRLFSGSADHSKGRQQMG